MTSLRILVVGGTDYIGSHTVKILAAQAYSVTTLDNLSAGYREVLATLFARQPFDVVMHFASYIQVGKTVKEPSKYYANDVTNTLNLLDAMVMHGVKRIIFFLQRWCMAIRTRCRSPKIIPKTGSIPMAAPNGSSNKFSSTMITPGPGNKSSLRAEVSHAPHTTV